MSIPLSAETALKQHVTLEVAGVDRLYLNAHAPGLQTEGAIADFFRRHRGEPFASSPLMAPDTQAFVVEIERFVAETLTRWPGGSRLEREERFVGDTGWSWSKGPTGSKLGAATLSCRGRRPRARRTGYRRPAA